MTRILFLLALAIGFVSCKAASCANSGLTIRQTTFDGTFNQNDIVWLRDPSQSDFVGFVLTSSHTVWRTKDNGRSWLRHISLLDEFKARSKFSRDKSTGELLFGVQRMFSSRNQNIIYLEGVDGRLWTSINYGESFNLTKLANSSWWAIQPHPVDEAYLAAGIVSTCCYQPFSVCLCRHDLIVSGDYGLSWRTVETHVALYSNSPFGARHEIDFMNLHGGSSLWLTTSESSTTSSYGIQYLHFADKAQDQRLNYNYVWFWKNSVGYLPRWVVETDVRQVNGTTKVVDIEAVLDVEYDGRVVITQRPPLGAFQYSDNPTKELVTLSFPPPPELSHYPSVQGGDIFSQSDGALQWVVRTGDPQYDCDMYIEDTSKKGSFIWTLPRVVRAMDSEELDFVTVKGFGTLPVLVANHFPSRQPYESPITVVSFDNGATWNKLAVPKYHSFMERCTRHHNDITEATAASPVEQSPISITSPAEATSTPTPSASESTATSPSIPDTPLSSPEAPAPEAPIACNLYLAGRSDGMPFITSDSAPGIVIAAGNIGPTKADTFSLLFSTDGMNRWEEIPMSSHTTAAHFTIAANGQILVGVDALSSELVWSMNTGGNWSSCTMEPKAPTTDLFSPGTRNDIPEVIALRTIAVAGKELTELLHYDFTKEIPRTCSFPGDYELMEAGGFSFGCSLGARRIVWRKRPSSNCYGANRSGDTSVEASCKCGRSDYMCAECFEPNPRSQECEWVPSCTRGSIEAAPPANCTPGQMYASPITGYLKIPGDKCHDGLDLLTGPRVMRCPREGPAPPSTYPRPPVSRPTHAPREFPPYEMGPASAVLPPSANISIVGGVLASLATSLLFLTCVLYVMTASNARIRVCFMRVMPEICLLPPTPALRDEGFQMINFMSDDFDKEREPLALPDPVLEELADGMVQNVKGVDQ